VLKVAAIASCPFFLIFALVLQLFLLNGLSDSMWQEARWSDFGEMMENNFEGWIHDSEQHLY